MQIDQLLAETPPGVDDRDGRVHVTYHARLAYLGRVDPLEEYPAAQIRQEWRDSQDSDRLNARSAGDLILVYDTPTDRETVILTVFQEAEYR